MVGSYALVCVGMQWHTEFKIIHIVRVQVVIEFLEHSLNNVCCLAVTFGSGLIHTELKVVVEVPGHYNEDLLIMVCGHNLEDVILKSSQDSLNFYSVIKFDLKRLELLKSALGNP